jgi:hypothetical protein
MPDGLAATLAPHELLDVVTFLKSLQEPAPSPPPGEKER